MKIRLLLLPMFFLCSFTSFSQVKILFDATKAETAGNADWIIDADLFNLKYTPNAGTGGTKSNAQRYPTPGQSGITSTTAESYWKGGISAWGIDCAKRNYLVETLPWNGRISYGDSTNNQDLKGFTVFVVCEPNIKFTLSEMQAMMSFVSNGGSLIMVSDHTVSDRNNDSWDSPAIWNDFFTNNGIKANPFGMTLELTNIVETTSNIYAASTDSIINGPYGTVSQVMFVNGATISISKTSNASVKAVVYKTSAVAGGNTGAMVAYARYGKGKVFLIGDSSPVDDGTGNTSSSLYNGYFADANGNHQKLLMNAMVWMATKDSSNIPTTNAPSSLRYSPDTLITYYSYSRFSTKPVVIWGGDTGIYRVSGNPAFLKIDSLSGILIITNPTQIGSYPITVYAGNKKGYDSTIFRITVLPGKPLNFYYSPNTIQDTVYPWKGKSSKPLIDWQGEIGVFKLSPVDTSWKIDSLTGEINYDFPQFGPHSTAIIAQNSAGTVQTNFMVNAILLEGISRNESFSKISIFPNPADDFIKVDFGDSQSGKATFYDRVGARIQINTFINSNILKIDTDKFSNGIYWIELETKEGISYLKFNISHQ